MSITDVVLATHDLLDSAGLEHAFGGALALAYYGEPRATVDVDVCIFVDHAESERVVALFADQGFTPERSGRLSDPPVAGTRLVSASEVVKIDLFFSLGPLYANVAGRRKQFDFAGRPVPFVSVEDWVVFKLSFGRDKDWVDLAGVVSAGWKLDIDYIESQLIGLRGATLFPRLARLRRMIESAPR